MEEIKHTQKINWHRCNFMEVDDVIYYCEGLHERHEHCDMIKLEIKDIKSLIEDLKTIN